MPSSAHPRSDADLLASYLREGCEGSFAALVAAHQQMVLGTALRRTGDPELARDVAQQVFALLARKARWLAGRPCLSGWLHRAASYLGARAVRREARARARHEVLARENAEPARERERWELLDTALESLNAREREALVLHYFEDRSYAEMAAALGVSEAAARQRVSRAIRELGARLQRLGIRVPAIALLTSGAALQSTIPAQAGMAAAALAASASATPAVLLFTTIMSHTAAKLAVAAVALAALPVVFLQQTNARLTAERTTSQPAATAAVESGTTGSRRPQTAPSADVLAAWEELRAVQSSRRAAEDKLAALERKHQQIENEVVVSYGPVEDLARRFSRLVAGFQRIEELKKETDPVKRVESARSLESSMQDVGDYFVVAREAQKLESDPDKASRFYATLLGERAGLDATARERLAGVAHERITAMARAGLTAPQRPRGDATAWNKSRFEAFQQLEDAMLTALPADRRADSKQFAGMVFALGGDLFPVAAPEEGTK